MRHTAQKMRYSIKDFFSKYDQILRKLQFGHIYWRKLSWKTSFFVQWQFQNNLIFPFMKRWHSLSYLILLTPTYSPFDKFATCTPQLLEKFLVSFTLFPGSLIKAILKFDQNHILKLVISASFLQDVGQFCEYVNRNMVYWFHFGLAFSLHPCLHEHLFSFSNTALFPWES